MELELSKECLQYDNYRYFEGRQAGQHIRYSGLLLAGRSGHRIAVVARFSARVQTVSWAHPASYKMGTGPFLGLKRTERGVTHPCL